jgi:hypothetical protein
MAAPNLLHLWANRAEDWGAKDGRRFDFAFIGKNLHSNGGYFFEAKWFPLAGTVLVIAGLLWLLARNRAAGLALGVWFVLSWGIFVLFYAGGYYYGASSRYAVVSCAPVAIFMGIGLAGLYGALRNRPMLAFGLGGCGLISWVAAMHYVPSLSREAIEAVADVSFVAKMAPTLPEGSLVISQDPCMWLLQGTNSSQFFTIDHMVHEEMRELTNQYPGGVYVHWGFWQNAEPGVAESTAKLLAETNATEVARTQSQTFKLAIFRVDTPEALARFGGKQPVSRRHDTDLDSRLARARAEGTTAGTVPTPVP